ncbi:MAG: response regulator, partial [Rhodospirillales bacterium]|nr:response regulator [Rhodospirillales bacterium]
GRTLLAISAGGDAALAAPSGGLSATRRIEAPVPAILRVSLARGDMLAVWWSRASLIGSSALIVISFLALSILAVRRTEQRELRRLEQMVLPREHIADRERLLAAVATIACDLADCELLDTGQASQIQRPPGQAPPEEGRGIALALLRPDLVRIGPLLLQHRHAARFSATDLAFLRVLAEFARRTVAQQDAVAAAHREAGQALAERDSERAAQQAVQSEMSDASFTLDGDWRIVATNRNADRLLGEYADDLRHRTLWKVFPELVGTVFESQCRRALQDQHPVAFEMRWLRSESWIAVHAYPRAPGLAVYMQDISRQIGIDDRLREAAKMDAIGNLTGGIAHDFNNLLTVILGNIEILDLELPERGEIRDMHEQIRRAAQTATELTHQLLAFARRQPLSPADVDIGRLMIGLDGLLRRTLGATVTVDIRVPEGLWHARIDAAQLEAALVNLALNARDAMPGGGRFTLEAANLALRNPQTDAFGEIRPGNYVVISAADTGAGIPRDVIGRVFEPFFSTKPSGRGTGLGLSMVYGFVTQSGGHARIASEPGRGAVVRLYLPRAAGKPAAGGGGGLPYADPPRTSPPFAGPSTPTYSIPSAPIPSSAGPSSAGPSYPGPSAMGTFNSGPSQAGARAAPAPPRRAEPPPVSTGGQGLPGGAERILVVEDSDMVRDYAQAVLGGLGYAVTVAADGPEALALLDRGLCPELLLTDVLLPNGLDGLQLAEKVLARMPGLPVLYMSGYIENVDAYQSRLDPQTNLLLKPFRRASLAIMVRARLDAARRAR